MYYDGTTGTTIRHRWGPEPLYVNKRSDDPPRSWNAVTIGNLERGILGSRGAEHGHGAPIMFYESMPVSYLTSDGAGYVTGQVPVVDGGLLT